MAKYLLAAGHEIGDNGENSDTSCDYWGQLISEELTGKRAGEAHGVTSLFAPFPPTGVRSIGDCGLAWLFRLVLLGIIYLNYI